VVERTPQGWGNLQRLPPPLNSDYTELFFSQAADGTIYFISNRPGGLGGFDLYRARPQPGQPLWVENLGAPLNSPDHEWDPCIAPDQSFLVFGSTRPGGRGGSDLYVSFANGPDRWTAPVNLGDGINSPADEYAPVLSPDGRFLFFTRHDGKRGDIYWVATQVLDRFRTNHQP
jgi:Tol biopolymer transport system component